MNKLIARSLLVSVRTIKPPVGYKFKQTYATFDASEPVCNANNRLRLAEESYCDKVSSPFKLPYSTILNTLNEETEKSLPNPHMMVSKVQAKLLHQLVGILRPKNVLEIGGFTGYSAIAMGSALLPSSKLISLELDPKHIAIARKYIGQSKLENQIEVKEGPAGDSLIQIAKESPGKQFDLIFIDADKGGYISYYEFIMKHNLLSDHGVIVADNVLFYGEVHKREEDYIPSDNDIEGSKNLKRTAKNVYAFNQHILKDKRVEVVVLPIFDGLSLIRKKLT